MKNNIKSRKNFCRFCKRMLLSQIYSDVLRSCNVSYCLKLGSAHARSQDCVLGGGKVVLGDLRNLRVSY